MLALNPDTLFRLEKDILLQALPDLNHYYAFNVKGGDNFKLNHTAYWVLETIGSGTEYSKLLQRFSLKYKLQKEAAKQDLAEVIKYALRNKIIEEVKNEKEKK